ncbi:hypothetical protein [Thermogladius sp.]|uniref:hypothetical protein n=1 Tax=Thermogladius sp. TaxID=2023064 RepID=UPI003D09BB97
MFFPTSVLLDYVIATLILLAIVIVTYVIGRLVKYFITYMAGKTGFSDWMIKFHLGRAILRSGMTVGEFFGRVSMWVVLVAGTLLGLATWFSLVNNTAAAAVILDIVNVYVFGFVKAFIVIVVGFVLVDAFVGYVYKGGEPGGTLEFLTPVGEYLRLLFYLAVLVFALDVGGLNVKTLTQILIPVVWGLTVIMIILTVGKIVSDILGRVKKQ